VQEVNLTLQEQVHHQESRAVKSQSLTQQRNVQGTVFEINQKQGKY
jgi:hypothetical protein